MVFCQTPIGPPPPVWQKTRFFAVFFSEPFPYVTFSLFFYHYSLSHIKYILFLFSILIFFKQSLLVDMNSVSRIKCIYLLFSIQHQERITRHPDCLGFARKQILVMTMMVKKIVTIRNIFSLNWVRLFCA